MKINKNISVRFSSVKKGFTLIEILVVIGIIAVLSAVVLVAINPARQFKLARDTQRVSNVTTILNAIGQNMAEHKGVFDCSVSLPSSAKLISSSVGGVDIASCLMPNYISSIPYDPNKPNAKFATTTDYNTEYFVVLENDGRVKVSAVGEITGDISITR